MKKFAILLLGTTFLFLACNGKKHTVPESLIDIKKVVSQIDSIVTSIYNEKPKDSTHHSTNDIRIANIITNLTQVDLSVDQFWEMYQQTLDNALITWSKFKSLCDDEQFEEALNFYLGEDADNSEHNDANFVIILNHSSYRYKFFSEVVLPLMMEYKGEQIAINKYIQILQLEKMMEEATMATQTEANEYVPEVYPYVIRDLGVALARSGKMDEAQELRDELINAVFLISGDEFFSVFTGVKYASQLYLENGQPNKSTACWIVFKRFLEENKSECPEDDWQYYMDNIEAGLQNIDN